MQKYTYDDLALLRFLCEKKSTQNSPLHMTAYVVPELYKLPGFNNEKVTRAITLASEKDFVNGNEMFVSPSVKGEEVIYWNVVANTDCLPQTLEEKEKIRLLTLKTIYDITSGNSDIFINAIELAEELNIDKKIIRNTVNYLIAEHLLGRKELAAFVFITHRGVVEMEEALRQPDNDTEHFSSIVINNTVNIQGSNSAPIQVGNTNSTQNVTMEGYLDSVKEWIKKLEDAINTEHIEIADLYDNIETVKALLSTSKPNVPFLNASLETIKNIMYGVTGNAVFQGLLQAMPHILP